MTTSLPWRYACPYCGRIYGSKKEADECVKLRPHEKKRCKQCGKEHTLIADLLECCEGPDL